MKDDTISRQAAIDAMCELMDHWFWGEPKDELREVKRELEKLPSAQPEKRWIPCSEGLPNARTEVIVSCLDDSGDTSFAYTGSGWLTTDKEYWIVDNEICSFVVAWCEMPEPYREEGGE